MYQSDLIRKNLFEEAVSKNGLLTDRVCINLSNKTGVYSEVIREDEIKAYFNPKKEYIGLSPLQVAETFVKGRLSPVLKANGYKLDDDIDYTSSDFYDGYEINVPFHLNESFNEETFFEELDALVERIPPKNNNTTTIGGQERTPQNKAVKRSSLGGNQRPISSKPSNPNLPLNAKKEKTQNPRKVDLLLKSVFESKFLDYTLSSDVGGWKPIKTLKDDGKLVITWENIDESKIRIETIIFPSDTNKIDIKVYNSNEVVIDYFFEIYRIPTDAFLVEKFFRKTYFNLLKKFIETRVIQIEPFAFRFVFWKTDNPFFSYSFSSPKKNKIIKDLIGFISIARKPILDDFFEQNNLKHKQGYLQTLLDSAEAAGIFKFAREGNEILIIKGPNYKAFLDGNIRRVAS